MERLSAAEHPNEDAGGDKAKARRRRHLNCAECRRLKLKCNRQWPCHECVKRGCPDLCPLGVTKNPQSRAAKITALEARIGRLEARLRELDVDDEELARLSSMDATSAKNSDLTTSAGQPSGVDSLSVAIGQLTLDSGGRSRFFGRSAAPYLVPSANQSDAEEEENAFPEDGSLAEEQALVGEIFTSSWPLSSSSSANTILLQARAMLPPQDVAMRRCELYWDASCWRFEPFTHEFFDEIFTEVYFSAESAAPEKIALVYAVLAIGTLFDPFLQPHSAAAHRYHLLAQSCLSAGKFLVRTSVASLATLHLHCGYLLNSDRPRSDEIYAIIGLALRLATIAGFHRDGSWWNLPQPELDQRRRIWWELLTLERVNSYRFGCPSFVGRHQWDTKRPTDQNSESFLYWRWNWDELLHDMLEKVFVSEDPPFEVILQADEALRECQNRLPARLQCSVTSQGPFKIVSNSPLSLQSAHMHIPGPAMDDIPLILRLQQYRLAFHLNVGLLFLHRGAFARALNLNPEDPTQSELGPSVVAVVVEAGRNILNLVDTLYRLDSRYTRSTTVALDLFGSLACQAALVIRSPLSVLAEMSQQQLHEGLRLLEFASTVTPSHWYKILHQRAHKLASRASAHFNAQPDSRNSNTYPGRPVAPAHRSDTFEALPFLGASTKLERRDCPQNDLVPAKSANTSAPLPMPALPPQADDNFDEWLASFASSRPQEGYSSLAPPSINVDFPVSHSMFTNGWGYV